MLFKLVVKPTMIDNLKTGKILRTFIDIKVLDFIKGFARSFHLLNTKVQDIFKSVFE